MNLLLNEVNHVVTEVYYILELRNNLLSIMQLQERGLTILIKGGMCKIFHPDKRLRTLLYKNMVRGLPQLSASSVTCIDCINEKQHCDPIPKKST